ncbi:MAG: DUF3800 domain-containing protein [Myxococcales bacterium]|nr:DUF3800 domain-containing protein [Myxococcales bacterium]
MSSNRTRVYIDECGFTGENLLDRAQPVFVLASHAVDEQRCAELKTRHFCESAASELKYGTLRRRDKGRRAVLAFLAESCTADQVRVAIAHKPFCVAQKIVDWVIEPSFHASGRNLYQTGAHVGLANLIFFALGAKGDLFERVSTKFQTAVREPSSDAEGALNTLLLSSEVDRALAPAPNVFRRPIEGARGRWSADLPAGALDLGLPFALQLCYSWRQHGWDDFEIVHDASSQMAKAKAIWERVVAADAPPASVGWGTKVVEFPIGIREVRFEDSMKSAALQLADVLAGAFAHHARWMFFEGRTAEDAFARQLHEILMPRLGEVVASCLMPDPEPDPWPPRASGTVDPLDYVTARIRGRG